MDTLRNLAVYDEMHRLAFNRLADALEKIEALEAERAADAEIVAAAAEALAWFRANTGKHGEFWGYYDGDDRLPIIRRLHRALATRHSMKVGSAP